MSISNDISTALGIERAQNPSQLAALSLAYIGDTVYDLFTRTYLVNSTDAPVHRLHLFSASMVCAKGQAEAYFRIEPMLTETELAVFKRGRNAHSGTVPKNATVADYHNATGLETLLGYLYLGGEDERLNYLMQRAFGIEEKNELSEETL